jgi:hypothetical protein
MDTFLTLVIAIGGIATGIGAIWTAMLGRRQLRASVNRLATFHTWQLSERSDSPSIAACHIRYSPIDGAS